MTLVLDGKALSKRKYCHTLEVTLETADSYEVEAMLEYNETITHKFGDWKMDIVNSWKTKGTTYVMHFSRENDFIMAKMILQG